MINNTRCHHGIYVIRDNYFKFNFVFVTNFCNVFKGICIRKTYQRGIKSA